MSASTETRNRRTVSWTGLAEQGPGGGQPNPQPLRHAGASPFQIRSRRMLSPPPIRARRSGHHAPPYRRIPAGGDLLGATTRRPSLPRLVEALRRVGTTPSLPLIEQRVAAGSAKPWPFSTPFDDRYFAYSRRWRAPNQRIEGIAGPGKVAGTAAYLAERQRPVTTRRTGYAHGGSKRRDPVPAPSRGYRSSASTGPRPANRRSSGPPIFHAQAATAFCNER